jgi:hypothetical protein
MPPRKATAKSPGHPSRGSKPTTKSPGHPSNRRKRTVAPKPTPKKSPGLTTTETSIGDYNPDTNHTRTEHTTTVRKGKAVDGKGVITDFSISDHTGKPKGTKPNTVTKSTGGFINSRAKSRPSTKEEATKFMKRTFRRPN